MEEIKVGEFVRTKTGNITKIIKVKDTVIWTDEFMDVFARYNEGIIEKKDISKHSFNIIDLIEVGDYVNGKLVRGKAENNLETLYICLDNMKTIHTAKDIKSILTK